MDQRTPSARTTIAVGGGGNVVAIGLPWATGNVWPAVTNRSGIITVYENRQSNWVLAAELSPPEGRNDDEFGSSLIVLGDSAAVSTGP